MIELSVSQVGSKSVLEFLTKSIKALEKDTQAGSSSRRQELINELKKRRHLLAMRIAPRDSRSDDFYSIFLSLSPPVEHLLGEVYKFSQLQSK